jgi:hypothetical protein
MINEVRVRNGMGGEKGMGKLRSPNIQLPTSKMGKGLMAPRSEVDGGRKIGRLIFDLTKGDAYIPLSVL